MSALLHKYDDIENMHMHEWARTVISICQFFYTSVMMIMGGGGGGFNAHHFLLVSHGGYTSNIKIIDKYLW